MIDLNTIGIIIGILYLFIGLISGILFYTSAEVMIEKDLETGDIDSESAKDIIGNKKLWFIIVLLLFPLLYLFDLLKTAYRIIRWVVFGLLGVIEKGYNKLFNLLKGNKE